MLNTVFTPEKHDGKVYINLLLPPFNLSKHLI